MESSRFSFCPLCDELCISTERNRHIFKEHKTKICVCVVCKCNLVDSLVIPHIHYSDHKCVCRTCTRHIKNEYFEGRRISGIFKNPQKNKNIYDII